MICDKLEVSFLLILRRIIGSKTNIQKDITILTEFQKEFRSLESVSDFYQQIFGM